MKVLILNLFQCSARSSGSCLGLSDSARFLLSIPVRKLFTFFGSSVINIAFFTFSYWFESKISIFYSSQSFKREIMISSSPMISSNSQRSKMDCKSALELWWMRLSWRVRISLHYPLSTKSHEEELTFVKVHTL